MTQFWGERYRDYYVDYCLPSLLAPNNLPLLRAKDGHCFLIATPREDWDAIEHLPIIEKLRQFVTPTLVETPAPTESGYAAQLRHQTYSLKRLFEAGHSRNGYGCALWPDNIFSDKFVAAMLRWVETGYHLVLQPMVRVVEENVLADLRAKKLLPQENRLSLLAEAIIVPPRVVGDLSVRHMHVELEYLEEGHPSQPLYPPYRFWRVPGRRGIILHVFFASPMLMDFAVVPANHTECLERGDWETYYVGQNFSHCGGIYVVTDSDESGVLSITPASVNHADPKPPRRFGAGWMPHFALLCNLRASIAVFSRARGDVVRRDLFRVSVRWHADDIDDSYRQEELRILQLIDRAAGDYYANMDQFPSRISLDPRYFAFDVVNEVQSLARIVLRHLRTMGGAIAGDQEAATRVRRKVRRMLRRLTGDRQS